MRIYDHHALITVQNDRGAVFDLHAEIPQTYYRRDVLGTGKQPGVGRLPAFIHCHSQKQIAIHHGEFGGHNFVSHQDARFLRDLFMMAWRAAEANLQPVADVQHINAAFSKVGVLEVAKSPAEFADYLLEGKLGVNPIAADFSLDALYKDGIIKHQ